ncbi:ArnT family glycosyltransferase [Nibricoccus sp. IMCC34717]|uniref:ArnT family glycosyltransferase n=1 Tax=Nibricoccus sp. IMCC34717 TaxID=3034021 RepID=UPI00384E2194
MRRPAAFWIPLLTLAAFVVVELLVFDRSVSKHYAWIYPRWNDQVQYLTEAYTYHEHAKAHGLGAGLWAAATKPSAQGMLHAPAAVALFAVAGPSRSAALFLNGLALVAFQAVFFLALRRRFSTSVAWMGVALSLGWLGIYSGGPGSAVDFRLDFLAACAFGLSLAVLLCSDGLRSLRWTLAFGCAVAATLLTRFLTGTYFVVIFLGLAGWVAFGEDRARRLRNLVLAGGVTAALAGPFFWLNRTWIYDYYYIGHYVGPESAIRNQHMNLWASLQFLKRATLDTHLPGKVFIAMGALAAVLGVLRLLRGGLVSQAAGAGGTVSAARCAAWFFPATLFLVAPLLVLTLHSQKSHIVLGVFVPALLALGAGAIGWVACGFRERAVNPAWAALVAALAVGAGFALFTQRLRTPAYNEDFRQEARRVNAIADRLYERARSQNLDTPRVAVDLVTDSLDAQIMRVIGYERKRHWVPFVMTLPTGIARDEPAVLRERLAASDFVFVAPDGYRGAAYPYDVQMTELRPETRAWCREHLRLLETFTLGSGEWELYGR